MTHSIVRGYGVMEPLPRALGHNMKNTPVIISSLVAFAACNANLAAPGIPAGAISVGFELVETVHTTQMSGFTQSQRGVIVTQGEFDVFWADLHRNVSPQPAAPAFDFATSMVIVAGTGLRNTGGFSISIENVASDGSKLFVQVNETVPGPNCATIQVITSPVTAVLVPLSDHVLEFVELEEIAGC